MKRPPGLLPFLAFGASLVVACTGAASPSPAAQSPVTSASPSAAASPITAPTSLIKPGTVTDCVDIEYPPMEMFPSTSVTDPNMAVGFDVEGAQAVAKAWNLPLTVRNVGFDALIPDLSAGRCDLVWTALYISDARLKVADEFQQIVLGRVDAVWETDTAVLNFQFTNPGKYENAFAFPKDRTYGVYFQKNKADVKTALQAALLQLKTDGTLGNLATKYKLDPTSLDAIK